jgi:hypothetical protein
VSRVYSVTIFWWDMRSIVYYGKEDGVRLNVYACYSWETALNVGLDVSFDSMQDWKGIWMEAGEVKIRTLL